MAARHTFLISFGSTGDLIPLLRLGRHLQSCGSRVQVITGPAFAGLVAQAGLNLLPTCTEEEHSRSLAEAPLLSSRYAARFIQKYAVPWNATALTHLTAADPAETVCISSERPIIWADLCARLHRGIPCIRLAVDPPMSVREQQAANSNPQPRRLEMNWIASWCRAARHLGLRAGWNHPRRLVRATLSKVPRFGLWPDWFDSCPHHPNLRKFGFLCEAPDLRGRNESDSERPSNRDLVFVAGSMGTNRDWILRFSRVVTEVCRKLGLTGLILGCDKPTEIESQPQVVWRRFLPLSFALNSATAVIHHAGIGTIAASLKAGLPQLAIPRVFGQFSNARQAVRLGFARELSEGHFDAPNLGRELRALLSARSYAERAKVLGARIDSEGAAAELVRAINAHVDSARHSAPPIIRRPAVQLVFA